jgi:hypothetical protein
VGWSLIGLLVGALIPHSSSRKQHTFPDEPIAYKKDLKIDEMVTTKLAIPNHKALTSARDSLLTFWFLRALLFVEP